MKSSVKLDIFYMLLRLAGVLLIGFFGNWIVAFGTLLLNFGSVMVCLRAIAHSHEQLLEHIEDLAGIEGDYDENDDHISKDIIIKKR